MGSAFSSRKSIGRAGPATVPQLKAVQDRQAQRELKIGIYRGGW